MPKNTFKKNKTHNHNKKLDLEIPPNEEKIKEIELNKEETKILTEYTHKEKEQNQEQEIDTKQETSTQKQEPQEEVYDVLHDLKNMMEDLYYEDEFDDFDYIAKLKQIKKKYNKEAPNGKEFILITGEKIKTINELRKKLREITKETFEYHVNNEKNDFYNWINDVFKYKGIAYKIKRTRTKKEMLRKLKP